MEDKPLYFHNFNDDQILEKGNNVDIKSPACGKIIYHGQIHYYFGRMCEFVEKKEVKNKIKFVKTKKLCLFILNYHTNQSLMPSPLILRADNLTDYKFKEYTGYNLFSNQWDIKDFEEDNINFFYANVNELFNKIKSKFKIYIDFPDKLDYTFMALWVMGTYFFHIFNSYPYVHIHGFKNSGKTKVIQVASKMAFNPLNSSSITPSALFRVVDSCQPTLFLDEFEPVHERRKTRSDDEMVWILNSGYKKGGSVIRSVKGSDETWEPSVFNTYSPKLISNIGGLNGPLESRCIKIVMIRAKKNDKRANAFVDEEDEDWATIRKDLYHRGLVNAGVISREYNDKEKVYPKEISNRDLELLKPIFIMAGYIDDNNKTYNEMVEYAIKKIKDKDIEDSTFDTWENKLINTLLDFKDRGANYYQIKEITQNLWDKEFLDEENSDNFTKKYQAIKPSPGWVGHTLRKIPHLEFKKPGNRSCVYLDKFIIKNIACRLSVEEKESKDETKKDSDDSDNTGTLEIEEQFVDKGEHKQK